MTIDGAAEPGAFLTGIQEYVAKMEAERGLGQQDLPSPGCNPEHFSAGGVLPAGSHVLVIEDTRVGGGRAQSAVLAVRAAGAARVSLLVVARWLNDDFQGNAELLRELAGRD